MPDLPTLEKELANVRQEVRNLQVLAMQPGHSPDQLELLRNLERSARAEVKLRLKAIEYEKSRSAAGTYLMTPPSIGAAAQQLRQWNPSSRAAELHELVAKMQESQSRQ